MKSYAAVFLCLLGTVGSICFSGCGNVSSGTKDLVLNDSNYFETRGLDVLVFNNLYDAAFDDAKISGVEMIHHGVRTVTNGDVRLNPTPGQWDPHPVFVERKVNRESKTIDVVLKYPAYDFQYTVRGEARDGGVYLSVHVDAPVPEALNGAAGFNIEFVPTSYFGKSYIMDGTNGLFPSYPSDLMGMVHGENAPKPLASGKQIEIAPDDPERHVTIRTVSDNTLSLLDGRNQAQNGWFVVRSLLPAGKSGKILEWFVTAQTIPGWTRKPVIAHSQAGYHPSQKKVAVIELDRNDVKTLSASLLKVNVNGTVSKVLSQTPQKWGAYLRYNYLQFDFSSVKEPGIYALEYGDVRTAPFPIGADVYRNAWQPTLDVFLPVQMDHVFVREGYRVWHGASHLDDALQAPLNYSHWDGWSQGPETGNKYKPLEHIPGLNVGGWFDAGDFDIQTGSQHTVVLGLVHSWEKFGITRDVTTVSQKNKYVELHVPDGQPDILQQIEHGALQLVAQVKAVGYAIMGINESHLYQYRHLGDAVNKTDNLIYNPRLDSLQTDGRTSGTRDDRYAFTNRTPFMNYGTAASLAAASRALKGYNDPLAEECLEIARFIWKDEHSRTSPAATGAQSGFARMMGNSPEFKAAGELFITTGDEVYKSRINELLPEAGTMFAWNAAFFAYLLPYMDESYKQQLEPFVKEYAGRLSQSEQANPFGVTISNYLWGGNETIIQTSSACYLLHQAYPHLIDRDYVYRGLNYVLGWHPDSDISFVSAVGAVNKKVAYGNNRADFTFIAGGVVPGIRILNPDFPENREDWPFFWSENEYTIGIAAEYLFLVNAVNDLLKDE